MANGCAMLVTFSDMQEFNNKVKNMKKLVFNVCFIVVMAIPCAWLFSDSLTLQFLGLVYAIGYTKNVIVPICRRVYGLMNAAK